MIPFSFFSTSVYFLCLHINVYFLQWIGRIIALYLNTSHVMCCHLHIQHLTRLCMNVFMLLEYFQWRLQLMCWDGFNCLSCDILIYFLIVFLFACSRLFPCVYILQLFLSRVEAEAQMQLCYSNGAVCILCAEWGVPLQSTRDGVTVVTSSVLIFVSCILTDLYNCT